MMNTLGTILKRLRKEKDITQEELAKALLVSRDTLANWEIDRATPGINTIKDIAKYFDVSADYLLGIADTPFPNNALRLIAKEWPKTISILYRKGKSSPARDRRAAKIVEVAIPAEDEVD